MQTLTGGCHCGAVRFEATADPSVALQCNCSHCQIKGFILTFAPRDNLRILQGEDKLVEYRFNKHVIAHQFCSVCGVQTFGFGAKPDGTKTAAINLRCIDGLDLAALSPRMFNGRNL